MNVPENDKLRLGNNRAKIICPCVDINLDEKLINSHTFQIYLHGGKSCAARNSDAKHQIYWTPFDQSERPKSGLVRSIDGVKFNYLKVIYDRENSYYSCTRNDGRWDNITRDQAQDCMAILQDTCDRFMPHNGAFSQV